MGPSAPAYAVPGIEATGVGPSLFTCFSICALALLNPLLG